MLKRLTGVVLIAMPIAAQAQTVTIKRGETVTLTIADDGSIRVVDKAEAAPNNFEIVGSAEVQRGDYDQAVGPKAQAVGPTGSGALAPTPPTDRLVLRFVRTPEKDQSMLSIQNGYGRALTYRAVMHVGKGQQATDVCTVIPGKIGIESWPFAIDALDLSDIKLVAWKPEDGVVCA